MKKLFQDFGAWCKDAAERALRAFIVTFTGLTAGAAFGVSSSDDIGLLKRALIAGFGSAASVVLSLAAKWAAGDPATASFVADNRSAT